MDTALLSTSAVIFAPAELLSILERKKERDPGGIYIYIYIYIYIFDRKYTSSFYALDRSLYRISRSKLPIIRG